MNFGNHLWHKNIVLAYSAGPDSTALLHMLQKWCKSNNKQVVAVHIIHAENQEAEDALGICKQTCIKIGVPLYTYTITSLKITSNVDHIWRKERYKLLREHMQNYKEASLTTAHHKDDLAETCILQVMRGMPLIGIPAYRSYNDKQNLIRPLLDQSKNDLEKYCLKHELNYYQDPENLNYPNSARARLRSILQENDIKGIIQAYQFSTQERESYYKYIDQHCTDLNKLKLDIDIHFKFTLRHWLSKKNIYPTHKQVERLVKCFSCCKIGSQFVIGSAFFKVTLEKRDRSRWLASL